MRSIKVEMEEQSSHLPLEVAFEKLELLDESEMTRKVER